MLILITLLSLLAGLVLYITPKKLYIIIKTFPRDMALLKIGVLLSYKLLTDIAWKKYTVPKRFRDVAKENRDKVALYFEDQKWTFGEMDRYSNKVAQYFKAQGFKKGDSIALLLDNCPEYICLWLGLAKLGVTTALINTNLKVKETLAHAVKAGRSKSIIYGTRFQSLIESTTTIMPELKSYQFNDENTTISDGVLDLKSELSKTSHDPVDEEIDAINTSDCLIYIYTSGTTGLPKASIIRNLKYYMVYLGFHIGVSLTKNDCIYAALPLYHALGGIISVSQCLLTGSSVVIRKKFSASNYWSDLAKYNCTASLYIGEMARYVVLAERNSKQKVKYTLKKLFGNGMKPSTWKELNEILDVEHVYEFYGSTEANFGLFNLANKIGSCGFMPVSIDSVNPIALLKCNSEGEPIRNADGFCETADYDERGLLVCKITPWIPLTKFDGYSDAAATNKKILQNVYTKNDRFFNTGDILSKDEYGFFYFRDRTGDTFRWKGENVATTEVEDVLTSITNRDIAVYGVEIPENEGRAGMVAVVDKEKTLDLKEFLKAAKDHLPSYSVPLFVRLVDSIPQTSTFKMQKTGLTKEGYDINEVKDPIYFLDSRKGEYVLLTPEVYKEIQEHKVKV